MPELPEVEEVRRTLEPFVLGVRVEGVRVLRRDFLTPTGAPVGRLAGKRIVRTHRHGKKMFLVAEDGQTVVVHLGMSGRVDCVAHGAEMLSHTHVVMAMASGTDVRLRDPRRFGGVWYYATHEEAMAVETGKLGKDALEVTAADFGHWRKASGRLKQRLLSQKDVAGLGNIYVDEALWAAQLHPLQMVNRIKPAEIERLVKEILAVLRRSLESGGTTLRDYRNVADQPGAFARKLKVYGRGGEACLRCGTTLKIAVVATRTTVFCPMCQKRK